MYCHGPEFLQGPVSQPSEGWMHPCFDNYEELPADPLAMGRLKDIPIRLNLVKRVRQEIALGTYETPEKLEIAFGRMLDGLGFD
jgi:hypothetical protein